jgi:hypothetical protein
MAIGCPQDRIMVFAQPGQGDIKFAIAGPAMATGVFTGPGTNSTQHAKQNIGHTV